MAPATKAQITAMSTTVLANFMGTSGPRGSSGRMMIVRSAARRKAKLKALQPAFKARPL